MREREEKRESKIKEGTKEKSSIEIYKLNNPRWLRSLNFYNHLICPVAFSVTEENIFICCIKFKWMKLEDMKYKHEVLHRQYPVQSPH